MTCDTTVYADGSRSENLGGLLYTLSTLAYLAEGRLRILPVANVGADLFETVTSALALPGVDTSCLRRVDVPNNHVYLTYLDAETRDEVLVGLVPPVDLAHALRAQEAAWLLVNLTSGRDIDLETFTALRHQYPGTVHLDVHSLTLGFTAGGRRVLERPVHWREWIACADWVQMNETEALLLGEGIPPERFARETLDLGPQGVLVTLGRHGCLAAWREDGLRHLRLPATHHPNPPYPTGCGDVFGATFAYARLQGAPVADAIALANAVASTKACFEPYAELRRIRTHAAEPLARWVPGS
jgi:sugar/nucleoside kinase (ribokinase family)